jgi:H+/Cl- antiporter ClcA
MKKAFVFAAALFGSVVAFAQDKPEPLINRDFIFDLIHIIAVLLVIYLISSFILQLLRSNFDFRLKSKMLERQTDENVVGQLVQTDRVNPLNTVMQWICTLASVGVGFILIEFTQPFGLHSLAIMAFCVAAGLGVYYYFAQRTKK